MFDKIEAMTYGQMTNGRSKTFHAEKGCPQDSPLAKTVVAYY